MKNIIDPSSETLQKRIWAAMAATTPHTRERKKALLAIRWVLREACGLYVGADGLKTALVKKADATVFSGCDNQDMKLNYFTAVTGGSFTIELI